MIRRIPLKELLNSSLPAYGGDSWDEVVKSIMSWPSENETVETLRAVLRRNGEFREPVYRDPEDGRIGNGMHRIVASILEDAPHVKVVDTTRGAGDDPESISVSFAVVFIDHDTEIDSRYDDGPIDYAMDVLRSFPLDDEAWVEADVMGSNGTLLNALYYCTVDRIDQLREAMFRRAQNHGIAIDIKEAVLWEDDEEED